MHNLAQTLKPLFIEAARSAFPELSPQQLLDWVTVEDPKDASHGDYACPLALRLAKVLGKAPLALAQVLAESFPKDFRVEKVEAVAPGFVNLTLSPAFLGECLKELEQGFSVQNEVEHERPVIVEYPSTNAAKHMGVHHILTTVIGDALANLFEFMGYPVLRINHFGDWGTHFGKLIYAVENWGGKQKIHANPTEELNRLYVQFNKEAEKKPELEDEARAIFKSLEQGDSKRLELWQWMVQESLEELNRILARLWIQVGNHMGESFYLKKAEDVLADGIAQKLFVEGEGGSLIFSMGEDETPALIQKSDGTTLYLTRDVATVKYRVDTWHPEAILYVVDYAQNLHFKQNFAIAQALNYAEDSSLEHIAFGRMRFADGSMSTRKGTVIKLEDLLDESVVRARALAKSTDMPREELERMLEVIGVSALKYALLTQDRIKDVVFDWDKIITLEGNSAPYLLYSYARAHSLFSKADGFALSGLPALSDPAEIELISQMVKFPQVLERALAERKPHNVATYLYELAQNFNRFYGKVQILQAEKDAKRTRLGLTAAFLHQMKAGLSILGVPVLERM
jgi:arginyl-tRNA synthetase